MAEVIPPAVKHDAYTYFGQKLMERHLNKYINLGLPLPTNQGGLISKLSRGETTVASTQASLQSAEDKVGIIGAGAGGLYAALMLDSLGIPYEILEASQRTGGRLYTHHFEKGTGTHNYYDVGAMRFPNIKAMTRLFKLFKYKPLNSGEDNLEDKLIPYYFKPREEAGGYLLYNNVRLRAKEASELEDPFHANEYLDGNRVASVYISAGVKNILSDAIDRFAKSLLNDLDSGGEKGWLELMENDSYSLRSFLSHAYKPSSEFLATHIGFPDGPLPSDVVNWMETMDDSTGSYDKAFSETILHAIAFGKVGPQPVDWKCLDGGSQVLSNSMQKYLQLRDPNSILFSKKASSIRLVYPPGPKELPSGIEVKVAGEDYWRRYSHVISTIPLPCLRTLDLDGCELSVKQTNAMRQLLYGPSVKIGILFKSAWWSQDPVNISGGQSFTDHPIRTVCYPSYGLEKGPNETHVLIASYCWTDDATRMGALINTGDSTVDKELTHIVLRDLAAVHGVSIDMLEKELVDIFPYDWTHNPLTMGAFAFFGPGEFSTLYETLNLPVPKGRLHFAGEALSTRHAWVVGALNSAWRAVSEVILGSDKWRGKAKEFFEIWDIDEEWRNPQFLPDTSRGGEEDSDIGDIPNLLYKFLSIHRSELF